MTWHGLLFVSDRQNLHRRHSELSQLRRRSDVSKRCHSWGLRMRDDLGSCGFMGHLPHLKGLQGDMKAQFVYTFSQDGKIWNFVYWVDAGTFNCLGGSHGLDSSNLERDATHTISIKFGVSAGMKSGRCLSQDGRAHT